MSFYNMLFGFNPAADVLLACLGITKDDVPRFRDCYLDSGKIVILTRTGGGNREDYEEENDEMTEIRGYLYDVDEEFDSTYATFYYSIPDEYKEDLQAAENGKEDYNPSEKWRNLIESIKKDSAQ